MTSKEVSKRDAAESRRRSPLDLLPPAAVTTKPLTPFSIEDILSRPSVKRGYTICGTAHLISASEKHRGGPGGPPPLGRTTPLGRTLLAQTSPLCALEELASKTFKGLEVSVLQAAEGELLVRYLGDTNKRWKGLRSAFILSLSYYYLCIFILISY